MAPRIRPVAVSVVIAALSFGGYMVMRDDTDAEPQYGEAPVVPEKGQGRPAARPAFAGIEIPSHATTSNPGPNANEPGSSIAVPDAELASGSADDPLMAIPPDLYDPGPPITDSTPRPPMEAISPAEMDPGPPATVSTPDAARPDRG